MRKKCIARKCRCLVKMVFGRSFMEEVTECEFKLLREKIKPKKKVDLNFELLGEKKPEKSG